MYVYVCIYMYIYIYIYIERERGIHSYFRHRILGVDRPPPGPPRARPPLEALYVLYLPVFIIIIVVFFFFFLVLLLVVVSLLLYVF